MFERVKDYKYQSYRQLKNDCQKADNLFNDPMFGADHLCIDIHGTMQSRVLQWLRPKEIYPDPRLGYGVPVKGKFSSPAMAAALTAITTKSKLREHIANKDQEWTPEKPHTYKGIFHFCFHYFGEWTDVVVDDRLPCQKHKLVYMSCANINEFWPALVEKAYAKLHGGYNIINNIPVTDMMSDLTGGVCEVLTMASFVTDSGVASEEWEKLFNVMEEAYNENTIFIATKNVKQFEDDNKDEIVYSENNISQNSLYVVAEVKRVNTGTIFHKEYALLLKLISPDDEIFTGSYSPSSVQWANLSDSVKKEVRLKTPREFWMPISDFQAEFTHLVMNHVVNTSMLALGKTWAKVQFRNWWSDGKAGGSTGDKAIFIRCNHQYFITITDEDIIVLLELSQKPQYTGAISSSNPFDDGKAPAFKNIGITILNIENNREYRLHRTHYDIVEKSDFVASRSVCLRTNLPIGRYCVIPSTKDMNESGEFVLRIFSSKTVNATHISEEHPSRHWLIKCFFKPHLAAVSFTISKLELLEGIVKDPEALDNLAKDELCVTLECEKEKYTTSYRFGCIWNEECTIYLSSPVSAVLNIKVYKKQIISSTIIGSSSIPLTETFGTVKSLDDTRDKEFNMLLRDKKNVNTEVRLKLKASFFSDLMDI